MLDRVIRLVGFLFFGIAVWLIAKEVHHVGWHYLWQTLLKTPIELVISVSGIVVLNYLILSGYDGLAFQHIGCRLGYGKILEASNVSFAFSNTTGHTYAAGGAIRYLFYIPEGVSRINVLKVVMFDTLSVLIGIITSFELAVLLSVLKGSGLIHRYQTEISGIAFVMAGLSLIYYMAIIQKNRILTWGKLTLKSPTGRETIKQIGVGLGDNITLFLCFYAILSFFISAPFTETFMIFMVAQALGYATQVPGGLGVFEGTFLSLFPHTMAQKADILASLILFRVFYYFLPFILSVIYLGIRFIKQKIS